MWGKWSECFSADRGQQAWELFAFWATQKGMVSFVESGLVGWFYPETHHLVGLVVKAPTSGTEDLGFESRLWGDFSGSSHTIDVEIGTLVATLLVSAWTGQPSVSMLWLVEVESLICNFYLSVAARKIVCADPSLRYTSMLLGL